MAPHKPLKLPLAAAEVDRAAHLRSDATYLDSAWPDAAVLLFCDEKFATKNDQLLFTTGAALGKYLDQSDYFLGVKDEKPFFVRHLESSQKVSLRPFERSDHFYLQEILV
jgi:NAD+ diphosphatase